MPKTNDTSRQLHTNAFLFVWNPLPPSLRHVVGARLVVQARATGPAVALGQLAVVLAQRARQAAEHQRHDQALLDVVLVDDLSAHVAVAAHAEHAGADALHEREGVGLAVLDGAELARDAALGAEAVVDALLHVDHAVEEAGGPRHCVLFSC